MRLITRTVWQMTADGMEKIEEDAREYSGPILEAKGNVAAPDPAVQANAEAAANRVNVIGPSGSQTYTQGPRTIIGYDSAGRPQYGTTSTQNIKLNPSEQRQFDLHNQIAEELLGGSATNIPSFANDPFSFNEQGSNAATAQFQRQKAFLDPEFAKADATFEQKMTNSGIPVGSEAYNDALRQHENDKNFALTSAAQGAEGTGAQLGLAERQQRYNEIAAALGGQQLMPVNALGSAPAPVDVAGAYAAKNAADMQNARNANAGTNALLSGLGTAAGTAGLMFLGASDERVKENIEHVGELPSGENVYEFNYKSDPPERRQQGVMAQEIEKTQPDAVTIGPNGMKMVDYRKVIAREMAA